MSNGSFDTRLLNGVSVLSAVVRAGNFRRAGLAMGLTQPAVSRAVSRLEHGLGVRLFHRTPRSVSLTEEGRRFYEAVLPLLAGIEAAAGAAKNTTVNVRGLLRVCTDRLFAQHILSPAVPDFLLTHPELDLEIIVQDRLGDLVADGFDVAIWAGDAQPSALVCSRLMDIPVVTCASPDYLARRGVPQTPRDLETGHECIMMKDWNTGKPFQWEFVRGEEVIAVNASGRLAVNDPGSLYGACIGGQGIGQPLEICVRSAVASGQLVPVLTEWSDETFPVHVYHHDLKYAPERVKVFLDFVAQASRAA